MLFFFNIKNCKLSVFGSLYFPFSIANFFLHKPQRDNNVTKITMSYRPKGLELYRTQNWSLTLTPDQHYLTSLRRNKSCFLVSLFLAKIVLTIFYKNGQSINLILKYKNIIFYYNAMYIGLL